MKIYSATIDCEAWLINVEFIYPPIPIRDFDWFAGFDNHEGYGCHGKTLEEALENLYIEYMDTNDYCLLEDRP